MPNELGQPDDVTKTARPLMLDEERAAIDRKVGAGLRLAASTDAQVLDALGDAERLVQAYIDRSIRDLSDSKDALQQADRALKS